MGDAPSSYLIAPHGTGGTGRGCSWSLTRAGK